MKRITTIDDVVQSHLCLGCGLCEYVRGREQVKLFDFPGEGIRPRLAETADATQRAFVSMCPGVAKPVKLNTMSVGVLPFMPSSWHMVACYTLPASAAISAPIHARNAATCRLSHSALR